jgi:glycosyltransferase involved in cell wall biosynthesis/peptidoglycan/xylan/chitin deacetylase (PgdA/CDA1 family)
MAPSLLDRMRLTLLKSALSALSPRGRGGRLTILQFHRIPSDGPGIPAGEMPLSVFESLMDLIAESMRVLPLAEATSALRRGNLPARAVAITFDDGYSEWLSNVAPVLQARGLHATFFVTTGALGGAGMWHERIENAVEALPVRGAVLPEGLTAFEDLSSPDARRVLARLIQEDLKYRLVRERDAAIEALEQQAEHPLRRPSSFDAESVRRLHAMGFEIGAHTVAHPILLSVPDDQAQHEIGESKSCLEGIIGSRVRLFAYPNGRPAQDFGLDHVAMVKRCGYEAAVVTGGGVCTAGTDLFELPRFTPWAADATRTVLHIGSNLLRKAPSVQAGLAAHRRRVLLVENGSGFGGAVVAAGTLLRNVPPEAFEFHVVSNVDAPVLRAAAAVKSFTCLNDRRLNLRPVARRVRETLPRSLARAITFMLGRVDDVANRLPYLLSLALLVARKRPDIIHGNNEPLSNREAMFVAQVFGIPYVQHVRGPYPRIQRFETLLDTPRYFIPVSRWLARELVQDGVEPQRVRQVYDGVDAQNLAVVDACRPHRAGRHTIAMVGMLMPWKGQSLFIEAARRLAAKRSDLHFLVIGGVPERGESRYEAQLHEQAHELVQRGVLEFLGHRKDVRALMASASVVVSASLEPEPLGLIMIEGLLAGAEFVGPAHGAAVEVLQALEVGELFTPGSAESLASAVARAVDGRRGAARPPEVDERLLAMFSPQHCVELTRKVYRSCVVAGGL